ncbi:hypothetical protein [Candidatus Deianiraea vastatrix]|uniref:Uncharacterized protein n=1 Tax=Candidatus Deianiraea vastatrix TaxID=2163644 RepID=A0A5B8XEH3_9RICK|nr:hypothetical protein [Candidatus Deianiraea vastatrix]QED23718.1 hypothetical protein Deia_00931 [Candidatus Deianiraea vastatrix]
MDIITTQTINNFSSSVQTLAQETNDLLSQIHTIQQEEFDSLSSRLDKMSRIINRNSMIIQRITKINIDTQDQEISEPSIADKQIMARTLAMDGLVIIKPDNPSDEQQLIYDVVQHINPVDKISIDNVQNIITEYNERIKYQLNNQNINDDNNDDDNYDIQDNNITQNSPLNIINLNNNSPP